MALRTMVPFHTFLLAGSLVKVVYVEDVKLCRSSRSRILRGVSGPKDDAAAGEAVRAKSHSTACLTQL